MERWVVYAFLSMLFAGVTAVIAKPGLTGISGDLGMAVRTCFVFVFVLLFAAAMGLLWLGTVPLTTGLLTQIFGVRYISTLFGFVFLGHQIGSFLGVWLGGYIFDTTRSYDLIWICAMALGVMSALLHWPIDDRDVRLDSTMAATT